MSSQRQQSAPATLPAGLTRQNGRLERFNPVILLQTLQESYFTGSLELISEKPGPAKQTARLWWKVGKLATVETANCDDLLKTILVENGLLSKRDFARARKEYYAIRKSAGAANRPPPLLHYLRHRHLVSEEQFGEVGRMLTEWQLFTIVAWEHGRWQYQIMTLPAIYASIPKYSPLTFLSRFEQFLHSGIPFSKTLSWEKGFNLGYGNFSEVPAVVVLNGLATVGETGELIVKDGMRRQVLRFLNGRCGESPNHIASLLYRVRGAYEFQRRPHEIIENDIRLADIQANAKEMYSRFFSTAQAAAMRGEAHPGQKPITKNRPLRNTTNLRASIEVFLEDLWEMVRPSMGWFLPVAIPLLLILIAVQYKISEVHRLPDQSFSYAQLMAEAIDSVNRKPTLLSETTKTLLERYSRQVRVRLINKRSNRHNYQLSLKGDGQRKGLEILLVTLPQAPKGPVLEVIQVRQQ